MLLNFCFNYIFKNDMNTNRTAIFNKTMFFGYMLYIFIYYFLGNKILFIVIFDNIYFLKNYLEMKEKPIDTNIISQNIIHKTILPKNKKKHFDSKYKPYIYNLTDTIRHLSNNIS